MVIIQKFPPVALLLELGSRLRSKTLQGYMLNDAGTNEVNATTGENVDTNGTGSVVYSNISGSLRGSRKWIWLFRG